MSMYKYGKKNIRKKYNYYREVYTKNLTLLAIKLVNSNL